MKQMQIQAEVAHGNQTLFQFLDFDLSEDPELLFLNSSRQACIFIINYHFV